MSPATIIIRLAVAVLLNVAALVLGAIVVMTAGATGLGGWAAGLAIAGAIVAPGTDNVRDLIDQLNKNKNS